MNGLNPEITARIHEVLGQQLQSEPYEVVEVVQVPPQGDKMVRLRTLEDLLQDFDGYLVRVRPKNTTDLPGPAIPVEALSKAVAESLYQHDGKLNIPFLLRNAEILFVSAEYALARNVFKAIFNSGTRAASALNGIGRCYEAEGKFEEAKAQYEQSIAYQANLEAFQHLAALLIKQKKDEAAAELLERALQIRELPAPLRFELHKTAGNCWIRMQRPQEAKKHYGRALELNPNATEVRANLGAIQLQSGKTGEAKNLFQDALTSNPRNDKALAGLASCFLAEGDKRLAHDFFAQALEIELNNPTAIYHLVKCAYELKTYATAARVLEEYIQIAPVNANLMYSLAGLQFHMGRIEEAAATSRGIIKLVPGHVGAQELLGLIEGLNKKRS